MQHEERLRRPSHRQVHNWLNIMTHEHYRWWLACVELDIIYCMSVSATNTLNSLNSATSTLYAFFTPFEL